MPESRSPKLLAAFAATALVRPGMVIGLGSGSTATLVIRSLGDRVRAEGLNVVGVATSRETAQTAADAGIPLRDVDEVDALDLCLDGADEIDPNYRMVKGRGGALLLEKIVASVARLRVTVVTPEKRVERLGRTAAIPVEVSAVGTRHIALRLEALGARAQLRQASDGRPYVTDSGNRIIDCHFTAVEDIEALDLALHQTVGVFETGIFRGLCDLLIVGHADHTESIPTGVARLETL